MMHDLSNVSYNNLVLELLYKKYIKLTKKFPFFNVLNNIGLKGGDFILSFQDPPLSTQQDPSEYSFFKFITVRVRIKD
jgi:hypothetical protein